VLECAELDINGMVFDFGVVKDKLKGWVDANLDHAYIYNDKDEVGKYLRDKGFKVYALADMNPTAENLAVRLYNVAKQRFGLPVIKVGIVESTETSIAWFTKG
jgi:6-pyruvoyl-tetrahydropterin synthase